MVKGLKIFQAIKNRIWGQFPQISYSRSGEDLIIEELFKGKMNGFYIDIGAFHPKDYSNTYKYYLNGWNGINIDANVDAIKLFDKFRPRDKNIFAAISDIEVEKYFYKFENDSSMNTLSSEFAEEAIRDFELKVSSKQFVKTRRLDNLLSELSIDQPIDFISIDVEGHDLEVLMSNNWEKFRSKAIIIETSGSIIEATQSDNEIVKYITAQNYVLIAYTYVTPKVGNLVFVDKDFHV